MKNKYTNDSAFARALKAIRQAIQSETELLSDMDYVDICEELAADLDARAIAKREEMESL